MTNLLIMDRQQALELMAWPFLEMAAPEFQELKDQLQNAVMAMQRKGVNCPPCVRKQYLAWEKEWLVHINARVNVSPDTKAVVEQFLISASATQTQDSI